MKIGNHQLYLGDFFREFIKVPEQSVDLVATDPPYGILERMYPSDRPIDPGFLAGILNRLVAPKGTIAIICCSSMISDLVFSFNRHFKYRYLEVWRKPSAQAKHKDRPKPDAEFVLVFDRKGMSKADRSFNWEAVAEQGDPYVRVNRNFENTTMPTLKRRVDRNPSGLRYPSTVIDIPNRPAMTREEKAGVDHPQQKSLFGVERLIRLLSRPNQTILDPFMGSATTLVSCQRSGRRGIGFEIERRYFNQAKSRLERELNEDHVAVTP